MHKFNIFNGPVEYNDNHPERYASGNNQFGSSIGASRMGATVYEVPPGKAVCPYHYESEEEWLLILEGEITLRHPDGEDVLGPGDITAFPVGPAGAHQTTNNGAATARMVMFSTNDPVGYCTYPDSDTIFAWTNSSDGRDEVRVRRGENLDYYDGEPL